MINYIVPDEINMMTNYYAFVKDPSKEEKEELARNGFLYFTKMDNDKSMYVMSKQNALKRKKNN